MAIRTAFVALTGALSFAVSAVAGAIVPVTPAPGSQPNSTTVFGINDMGRIVGSYVDQHGRRSGFISDIDTAHNFKDLGPAIGTARSSNTSGEVVGVSCGQAANKIDPSFYEFYNCGEYFVPSSGGIFKIDLKQPAPFGTVGVISSINNNSYFVGTYSIFEVSRRRAPASVKGYVSSYSQGTFKYMDITIPVVSLKNPSSNYVYPEGISDSRQVVGFFSLYRSSAQFNFLGFILLDANHFDEVSFFDSPATFLEGINNDRWVSGFFSGVGREYHAFVLSPSNVATEIVIPGVTGDVTAWGMNNRGEVAVQTATTSYIYCIQGKVGACNSPSAIIVPDVTIPVVVLPRSCDPTCVFPHVNLADTGAAQ